EVDGAFAEMVGGLPARLHRPAVAVLAERLPPQAMTSLVGLLPVPWTPELGTAVLDWLAAHAGNRGLGAAARTPGRTAPTPRPRPPAAPAALPVSAPPRSRAL